MSEHRSEASRLVSRSAFGLDSLAGPSAAPIGRALRSAVQPPKVAAQ
jgi:hypothetical protein